MLGRLRLYSKLNSVFRLMAVECSSSRDYVTTIKMSCDKGINCDLDSSNDKDHQEGKDTAELEAEEVAFPPFPIPAAGAVLTPNALFATPITAKRKIEDDENREKKKAKLETKALKAKRPGFTDERYNETSYYIENGLRKVYPYYFTFTTFTKGRWVGQRIIDVFAKEFRAHPKEEYERCIEAGTLTVNYEKVNFDYILKHNDLLANVVHRHEVPVTADPIPVIHMDDDIVVVDKPGSIPVHPCGRYRHNTVVFILAKEYNLKNLRTIHRLDRLTSGLLLFGRTLQRAREIEQQIRERQVVKEYVCRVEGEFPETAIECLQPIEVVSYKIGVCKVSPNGKECKTDFQRLSYNGKSSVVLCRPYTGRMHQIRVHLQYLGYPILNDPLYNHEVFGPNKGKDGMIDKSDDELIQSLINIHNAENWLGMDGDIDLSMFPKTRLVKNENSPGVDIVADPAVGEEAPGSEPIPITDSEEKSVHHIPQGLQDSYPPSSLPPNKISRGTQTGDNESDKDYNFKGEKMTHDSHCYECKVRYRDPKPKDLVMYLHALRYKGPDWSFETKLPDWANENWSDE